MSQKYTVQYWNEAEASWKGTGETARTDITFVLDRMDALSEQCDYSVTFRVVPVTA